MQKIDITRGRKDTFHIIGGMKEYIWMWIYKITTMLQFGENHEKKMEMLIFF